MNRSSTGMRDALIELHARLDRGICRTAQRSRPADWPRRDELSLADWLPADDLRVLSEIREDPAEATAQVQAALTAMESAMRNQRSLLTAILLSPGQVLMRAQATVPGSPVGAWFLLCWTATAAAHVIDAGLPEPEYGFGDGELLAPLAARLQFLAFSEPLRWRGQQDRAWWFGASDEEFRGDELLRRACGDQPWHVLVGQASAARRAWLDYLDSYQSHLFLSRAAPEEIEEELAAVVFCHRQGGVPLGLSDQPLLERAPLTADDRGVVEDVVERHLLPRFGLGAVIAIAGYAPARAGRWARRLWAAAALAAASASVVCAASLLLHPAVILAASCYLCIGAGAVAFGPAWTAPWLLRLPAASAIGIFALISLLPGGWLAAPHNAWAACVVLAGAAVGYLLIETRNHGVAPAQSLMRTGAVALVAAVHALLVSLLGLVVVAPAFVSNGSQLARLWSHPGYAHAGMLLLLAGCWCLAVGVFSQILWDDRPISAPLAHLSWRSGR